MPKSRTVLKAGSSPGTPRICATISKKSDSNEAIAPNSLIELSKFDIHDLDSLKLWRSGSEFQLDMKARTQAKPSAL